jgi:TetR/AcrR family transcriptional repressor of nem operon
MGHSQADKGRTHARIVEIAARRLRERGLENVGVAELMQEAGLTVGGFYKHFASRDELVAEAVGACFGKWQAALDRQAEGGPRVSFATLVDAYLSPAHRDGAGGGCPFGALAADLARSDPRTRAIATAELERNLVLLAGLIGGPPGEARRRAIFAYAALSGAIGLARVANDPALSSEILAATADLVKPLAAPQAPGFRRRAAGKKRR